MAENEFDFVVVGAGIVGSWTAKELCQHGKVLLLEQFKEPHTRGSSHGQSRLIRSGYEETFFADMMPHAFKMWRQAEMEMKEKLIEQTGVLCIADSFDNKSLLDTIGNMKRLCPQNLEELTVRDLKSRYSSKLDFQERSGVIMDKSGGVVFAHKAVRVIQEWYKKSGGIMWDGCKVHLILSLSLSKVKLCTSRGDVFSKSVVVCAGPWVKELVRNLAALPVEPKMVKVYYWKERELGAYSASSGFPATLDMSNPDHHIYSLPSLEYPGLVKVCYHGGVPCNPDEREKVVQDPTIEKALKIYVKEHFPLLEHEPSIVETCMYTCSKDEIFIIDTLPGFKNIVVGTGFSGTGFKTSPVVGRLLSELVREVPPFLNIAPYRLSGHK